MMPLPSIGIDIIRSSSGYIGSTADHDVTAVVLDDPVVCGLLCTWCTAGITSCATVQVVDHYSCFA